MSAAKHDANTTRSTGASRRKILGFAWLGSFVALTGTTFAGVLRFLTPRNEGGFGGVVRAGKVDEFPPGSMSLVKEGRFYLHRLDDGSFLAQWQRCTHLGCSVPWDETAQEFRCPCHGSVFSPTGEVLGGPAPRPLDVFEVSVQDGELFVDTGSPVVRSSFDPSQTTTA